MRILDQQRYWAFAKAYVVSFVSLVGLYIVIDAFTNIDEFLKVTDDTVELFKHIGYFYMIRISFFYDRLCGVITMLAAIFTVTWMQKNNELLAMLAAGISTRRAIVPVIVSSVVVSGLAVVNQEWIMPRVSDELQKPHCDDGEMRVNAGSRWDVNGIQLHAEKADRASRTIEPFHALLPVSRFGGLWTLDAPYGRYIPENDPKSPIRGGWLLWGGKLSPEDAKPDGTVVLDVDPKDLAKFPKPLDNSPPPGTVYFLKTSVTFTNITRGADWYQFATTPDLVRSLDDPSNPNERVQVTVFLHTRVVRPLTAMVLLVLSLPLVLGGDGRNMFINLGLSLGTSALFYGLSFFIQYLGNNRVMNPEITAWLPIIAFGTWAAGRWDRIRT